MQSTFPDDLPEPDVGQNMEKQARSLLFVFAFTFQEEKAGNRPGKSLTDLWKVAYAIKTESSGHSKIRVRGH